VPGVGAVAKQVDASDPKLSDREKELLKDQEAASAAAKVNLLTMFAASILLFIILLCIAGLGMLWGFLVMIGGVNVQNLESRGWGIAASVLVMFPVHTFSLVILSSLVMSVVFIGLLEDPGLAGLFSMVFTAVLCLLNLAVGVYMLSTLMSEEVIAGFE